MIKTNKVDWNPFMRSKQKDAQMRVILAEISNSGDIIPDDTDNVASGEIQRFYFRSTVSCCYELFYHQNKQWGLDYSHTTLAYHIQFIFASAHLPKRSKNVVFDYFILNLKRIWTTYGIYLLTPQSMSESYLTPLVVMDHMKRFDATKCDELNEEILEIKRVSQSDGQVFWCSAGTEP
ncbi:hypothetical protein BD770DRAFT_410878 [Pilaira anomala]|nr:hypothetical protein BD770DRAFT_410878 [Pilaira anomala]